MIPIYSQKNNLDLHTTVLMVLNVLLLFVLLEHIFMLTEKLGTTPLRVDICQI